MAKEKKNQSNKPNNTINKDKKNTKSHNQPLAPPTKVGEAKRKIGDLTSFLKKQQSISPPTVVQTFSLQYFLRNTAIQTLILQCPNLSKAIETVKKKISVEKNILYGILQCFFQGSRQAVWADKYKARNLRQCLHKQVGEKLKIWLKSFNFYKNTIIQESNSFIDDFFGQSNTQLKHMREFNWKLRGLVLKGRPGVGKTNTIFATAKDLGYEIYPCGNECNQIKYLKQKNEATQSQCVKTKINRNQSLIQRTNQSIATFAVRSDEAEVQNQTRKIQFMHNVNIFYPQEDQVKFYNELKKTVQSSKIPFIMTATGEKLPQTLNIYDVIEFREASTQDIATLLYLIYHIERNFKIIPLQRTIEKERFKELLNQQLQGLQFEIDSPLTDFLRITETFNKKMDMLLNHVQSRKNSFLDLKASEQTMKMYLKRASPAELMNDYFYNENKVFTEQDSSKEVSFQFIDTTKYLAEQPNQNKIFKQVNRKYLSPKELLQKSKQPSEDQQQLDDIQVPTLICTPNKEESSSNKDISSKTKTVEKRKEQNQSQHQDLSSQCSLLSVVKHLDIKVIEDYKSSVKQDECFIFNKLYNQSREQLQEKLVHNIEIQSHLKIRKDILRNVKKDFYYQNQIITSLKEKQLQYIGFLIDSRSRVSRKNSNRQLLNLKKLLKVNEINYLNTFTSILKPNSMESRA